MMCFNPRARVGRDRSASAQLGERHVFQSTRPRGATRHVSGCVDVDRMGFNPRARVGRDASWLTTGLCAIVGFNPRARVGRDR